MTNNDTNRLAATYLLIVQRSNATNTLHQPTNKAVTTQNKPIREAKFPTKEPANYLMNTDNEAGVQETSFVSDPATNKAFKLL